MKVVRCDSGGGRENKYAGRALPMTTKWKEIRSNLLELRRAGASSRVKVTRRLVISDIHYQRGRKSNREQSDKERAEKQTRSRTPALVRKLSAVFMYGLRV